MWVISMIGTGVSFGAFCLLPFIESIDIRIAISFVFAFFAGLAAGCGGMIGPSVQSDIVDYDELVSGERKEGSYFAAWNFVQKSAVGVMLLLTGFVLQFSGFVPNAAQTLDMLTNNIKEGINELLKNTENPYNTIDAYWMKLQSKDNWYILYPRTITQLPDYSDIEQREVNYNHLMLDL